MSLPKVYAEPYNMSAAIAIVGLNMDTVAVYNRYTKSGQFDLNKPFDLQFWTLDLIANGSTVAMEGKYELHVSKLRPDEMDEALPLIVSTLPTGTKTGKFSVPAISEAGWYRATVWAPNNNKSITHFFHVGVSDNDEFIPYWMHTYSVTVSADKMFRWCMIPINSERKVRASKPHPITPFAGTPAIKDLHIRNIVSENGERGVFQRRNGSLTTAHTMAYPLWHMVAKYPVGPQVDGPRNKGCISFVAGAKIGNATKFADPKSGLARIHYIWTLQGRFCRLNSDGRLTTLFGWRTKEGQKPNYWGERELESDWEFVGDRSRIPKARNHLARSWGGDWDPRTIAPNPGGEQTEGDGRESHDTSKFEGPVWFMTNGWTCDKKKDIPDIMQGSIWKVQFNGRHHDVTPYATEFATDLYDPFGLQVDGKRNEVYVSERGMNRIIALDIDTGKYKRTLVQGPTNYATTDAQGHVTTNKVSVAMRQAADCVTPEGLKLRGDWLYYSSLAMECIKRVNVVTGEIQVMWNRLSWQYWASSFMVIDVSDGTFYPEGSIFWCGFEAMEQGYPKIQLADPITGKCDKQMMMADWTATEPSTSYGRGPYFTGRDYATAVSVGNGMCIAAGSKYGVFEYTLAVADDLPRPVDKKAFLKGISDLSNTLMFTGSGESVFGHAAPYGLISPEADKVLEYHGIERVGTVEPPAPPPPPPPAPPPIVVPPPPPPPAPVAQTVTLVLPTDGLIAGKTYLLTLKA